MLDQPLPQDSPRAEKKNTTTPPHPQQIGMRELICCSLSHVAHRVCDSALFSPWLQLAQDVQITRWFAQLAGK